MNRIFIVVRPGLCGGTNSSEHMALVPLGESWRCDRGIELYEVPCAKKCGNIFGPSKRKRRELLCAPMLLMATAVLQFVRSVIPLL